MTEREKRLLGLPHYLFKEPEISEEITRTKDLCYEYNKLRPSDKEGQEELLVRIFQKEFKFSLIFIRDIYKFLHNLLF